MESRQHLRHGVPSPPPPPPLTPAAEGFEASSVYSSHAPSDHSFMDRSDLMSARGGSSYRPSHPPSGRSNVRRSREGGSRERSTGRNGGSMSRSYAEGGLEGGTAPSSGPSSAQRHHQPYQTSSQHQDSSSQLQLPSNASGTPHQHQQQGSNFKVVIRARPPLPRELNGSRGFLNVVNVQQGQDTQITISDNLAAVLNEDGSVRPSAFATPGGSGGADGGGSVAGALAASSNTHAFTFDHVYGQDSTQQQVYDHTARGVVDSSLQGYNATIFAYGQTGTGKTYTMEGYHQNSSVEERGIIPRAIEQIFGHIAEHASPRMRFLVRASYLQIYNEQISDLLKPERSNLHIREDKKRGVFVEGLSEWVVRSPAEIYGLMERGALMRATGSTKMNEISSRSHAVFIIIAEQSETVYVDRAGKEMTPEEFSRLMHVHGVTRQQLHSRLEPYIRQSFKVGKLNLVDLAGSERVRLSGATGQRLEESKKINQSLSALGNVISALTDPRGRNHIPYRDSKLTRILEDSLGGNCRTTMMAMISPAFEAMTESLSTLKFANRAKNIKNEAKINEDLDQKSLLRKYERELKRLRAELEERSRNVVDKRRLLELDEQRRRAEEDKMAAIRALEARSLEFMREKEEKRMLEQRITALTSQVIRGDRPGSNSTGGGQEAGDNQAPGGSGSGGGAGSGGKLDSDGNILGEQHERLRHEYEGRLQELEKERESIEEEKAQVDRYKTLLLKQRDIMIALTQRLNERDEQIMALQDELDVSESKVKGVEEKLDEKTAALIHLQRVTLEQNAVSPVKNSELAQALGAWAPPPERGGGSGGIAGGGVGAEGAVMAGGVLLQTPNMMIPGGPAAPSPAAAAAAAAVAHGVGGGGVGGSGSDGGDQGGALEQLLRAEQAKSATLTQELDNLREEKASMESMLRSKLEALVQAEIEARLSATAAGKAAGGAAGAGGNGAGSSSSSSSTAAAAIAVENEELKRALQQAKAELGGGGGGAGGGRGGGTGHNKSEEEHHLLLSELRSELDRKSQELDQASARCAELERFQLQQQRQQQHEEKGNNMSAERAERIQGRCAALVKERAAVQTIMELKVNVLVNEVAKAAAALMQGEAGAVQTLGKELSALQRLVSASIQALRNAAQEDAMREQATR